MKCINCGEELSEGMLFCTSCGTKVENVQENVEPTNSSADFQQPTFSENEGQTVVQNDSVQIPATEPAPAPQNFGTQQYQQPAPQPMPAQPVQPQGAAYGTTPPVQAAPVSPKPVDPGKNLGMASMILGGVSLFFSVILGFLTFFFIPVNLVALGCGIAGVITGMKSKKASIESGNVQSGVAKGGFICSIVGLIFGAILTILGVGFILLFILGAMFGS